jgi:multiple sugar transport system permease protein
MDASVRDILEKGLLAVVVAIFAFPVYWIIISGVKPLDQIISYPPHLIPRTFTLDNYTTLFQETDYLIWLKNSLIVASGNIVLSVLLSTFAGYSLARFDIYQRKNIARAFIFSYMFPAMMLGLPYFVLWQRLGLINTNLGLILAHTSVTLPFTTWIMWQFFQTVPIEWEESAWVMGASRFRSMLEVAMPAAAPGIVACAIFAFAISWNDFTFAFVLITSPESQVLTTGITQFIGTTQTLWSHVMVGATVLVIPPFLVVFFLNRYMMEGFSVSGLD